MSLPEIFAGYPAVYAVGREYQIFVPIKEECVMWVETSSGEFYDDSNGILRSAGEVRRIHVPMEAIDSDEAYTLCYRKVFERLPYFSKLSDVEKARFEFRPVKGPVVRIYNISDTHNRVDAPVKAGGYFGKELDLLVLNGDIPDHSGDTSKFRNIHQISGGITHGTLPVVFSRGNHDTRGVCAPLLSEYTPTHNGISYYSFRLGPLWGLVMDCAEDKMDSSPEYGHTICCHAFRLRETQYLKQVIADAEKEYEAEGVRYRMIVSHVPFSQNEKPPFDIEFPLFTEWCRLLKEHVRPDLMLCGHIHSLYVTREGDPKDQKGVPCPVVVASQIATDLSYFAGGALTLDSDGVHIEYTDHDRKVLGTDQFPLNAKRGACSGK